MVIEFASYRTRFFHVDHKILQDVIYTMLYINFFWDIILRFSFHILVIDR